MNKKNAPPAKGSENQVSKHRDYGRALCTGFLGTSLTPLLCQSLRAKGVSTPVMMLTARSGLEDRVGGLEAGADYYLAKPFHMEELLACMHTITRRRETEPSTELLFGDAELLEREGKLFCHTTGQAIKLGAKELALLALLFRNPGQILPRETLIQRVWGFESDAEYNNLEVYLSFARKKLAFAGSQIKIKAVRGLGYTLEGEP